MGATVHQLHENDGEGENGASLRQKLEQMLESHKVRLEDMFLSRLKNTDLDRNKKSVFMLDERTDQPLVLIGDRLTGVLLGNQSLRTVPFNMTAFRSGKTAFRPILNCGAFDGIAVLYCMEEVGVLVDAGFLVEKLHR